MSLTEKFRASIRAVLDSELNSFSSLAALAGLDKSTDFRSLNLSHVDFGGSDLRGFDFTGADLSWTNWEGAEYDATTIVSNALMAGAIGYSRNWKKVNQRSSPRSLKSDRQTTLGSHASVTGVGIHSGAPVNLTIAPAPINTGFVFVRTGLEDGDRQVQVSANSVIATEFATVLGDQTGPLVSTAEHVLAALSGMGVDNAIIEVDGPEVPIMDGSAAAFVTAIDIAGILQQKAHRRFIEVLKPVRVALGNSRGEFRPNPTGLRVEVEIDFPHPLIGTQAYRIDLTPSSFRREIARARTFGFMKDVARLWNNGFALGSSFENSLVFDEDRLLNPEGLRYADECARHKVLSAIGDLALAGLPLLGTYRSVRGGHKLNHAMLTALLADKTAWRIVEAVGQTGRTAIARQGVELQEKLSR